MQKSGKLNGNHMNGTVSNGNSPTQKPKNFNVDRAITSAMESFAFYMLCGIILYFSLALPNLLKFHNGSHVSQKPFEYSELIFIPIGFFFCLITFYGMPYVMDGYVRSNLHEMKNHFEDENQRVTRLIHNFHSLLYYLVSFSFGMYVTSGTILRPVMLNGNMDLNSSVVNWPEDTHKYVRWYFLFTLGHHLERQVNLWTHKRKNNDFWTLNLHHILTIFLMGYSYAMRCLHFGVPVVIIHDISDIMYNISKICRCVKSWRPFLNVSMVLFAMSWLYTRIICYTTEVLLPLKGHVNRSSYIAQTYRMIALFELFCLYVLGVLNYYWFFLICKIIFNLTRKNDRIINEERS